MYIIYFNSVLTLVTTSTFYLQEFWKSQGFLENIIGIVLALSSLAGAAGGFLAHHFDKKLNKKGMLLVIPLAIVGLIVALSFTNLSFISILFIGILDSVFFVATGAYLNDIIRSEERATIISFSSMFFSIFMIIAFPLFGYIGDIFGLSTSFRLLGLIGLVYILIYYLFFQNKIHLGLNMTQKNHNEY